MNMSFYLFDLPAAGWSRLKWYKYVIVYVKCKIC